MSDIDIVERLRQVTEDDAYALPWTFGETCKEAADEIVRLRSLTEFVTWMTQNKNDPKGFWLAQSNAAGNENWSDAFPVYRSIDTAPKESK